MTFNELSCNFSRNGGLHVQNKNKQKQQNPFQTCLGNSFEQAGKLSTEEREKEGGTSWVETQTGQSRAALPFPSALAGEGEKGVIYSCPPLAGMYW